MDVVHFISLNSRTDSQLYKAVKDLDIDFESLDLPGVHSKLINFEISEADDNWVHIKDLVEHLDVPNIIQTFFTQEEVTQSELLRLEVTKPKGYPQPQDRWVTESPNYHFQCNECGTFEQVESFRIKNEPNLGGQGFMTLHWSSPILVENEVDRILKANDISGYDSWDVLIHATGASSVEILQLYITEQTSPGLLHQEELGFDVCEACGERKYYAHTRGVMRYQRGAVPKGVDIMETQEWFGAGGKSAYKKIFITNRLASLILDQGWKGVMMKVVELVD